MDPSVLTVYKSPYPKLRLGKKYDGGYVVAAIPCNYTTFLSGGICDDISFEEHFIRLNPGVRSFAFDGTVQGLPKPCPLTFVKKNIGFHNSATTTNLHDLINANTRIFVKMDIEGGEIPWIHSLSDEQMARFEQIVMEFHFPFQETQVFEKINKNHRLVHFHGNNNCGVRMHKGVLLPEVFECTYLHKKYFLEPELNTDPSPSWVVMPNNPHTPDIQLNYPPFTKSKGKVLVPKRPQVPKMRMMW